MTLYIALICMVKASAPQASTDGMPAHGPSPHLMCRQAAAAASRQQGAAAGCGKRPGVCGDLMVTSRQACTAGARGRVGAGVTRSAPPASGAVIRCRQSVANCCGVQQAGRRPPEQSWRRHAAAAEAAAAAGWRGKNFSPSLLRLVVAEALDGQAYSVTSFPVCSNLKQASGDAAGCDEGCPAGLQEQAALRRLLQIQTAPPQPRLTDMAERYARSALELCSGESGQRRP